MAVASLPGSVAQISGSDAVDRFTVIDRSGAVLYDDSTPGEEPSREASAAWQSAWHRQPTKAEEAQLVTTGELVLIATVDAAEGSVEFPSSL